MFGVEDIPDLAGRVVVVTGANGGLGFQTASVLAAKGAHVVLAARDAHMTARAVDAITRAMPDAHLAVVSLDLGSLASVGTAAAVILAQVPPCRRVGEQRRRDGDARGPDRRWIRDPAGS